jgi:hypothetical protein
VPVNKIIVAHELAVYRHALAGAVRHLRPLTEAVAIDPQQLPSVLTSIQPELVIVSALGPELSTYPGTWLLLYPDGANRGIVGRGTVAQQTIENITFADIIALVDRLDGPAPEEQQACQRQS